MEIEEKNMRKKEMRISIKLAEDKDLGKKELKWKEKNHNQKIFIVSYKGKEMYFSQGNDLIDMINSLKEQAGEI